MAVGSLAFAAAANCRGAAARPASDPEPAATSFCWNEECQYCRVSYDTGEGTAARVGLSCKIMVQPGMRVLELAAELRYCLRGLPDGK